MLVIYTQILYHFYAYYLSHLILHGYVCLCFADIRSRACFMQKREKADYQYITRLLQREKYKFRDSMRKLQILTESTWGEEVTAKWWSWKARLKWLRSRKPRLRSRTLVNGYQRTDRLCNGDRVNQAAQYSAEQLKISAEQPNYFRNRWCNFSGTLCRIRRGFCEFY